MGIILIIAHNWDDLSRPLRTLLAFAPVLLGQGLVTVERLPMAEGRYLARNLDAYLVPTLADAPRAELEAIEDLMPDDPVGPRGAGEIAVNIAVPAIANAVSAAIGMPIDRLPIEPDDLLDFLERQP